MLASCPYAGRHRQDNSFAMPAIAFDRFYRYADLTAILNAFAAENANLVAL